MRKLIGPFSQILTMNGLPERGPIQDEQLKIIQNGGIVVEDSLITAIGSWEKLVKGFTGTIDELSYPAVAIPGLIDSHSHLCFGGTRQKDYAMRIAGKSYLEIAQEGGGIWDTVTQTRVSSDQTLLQNTLNRLQKQLINGVTTCEIKSGYGLSVSEELRMLQVIKAADGQSSVDVISTCLAAHTKPKDFDGDNGAYLKEISENLLPQIKSKGLSNRVDVFIENGAFNVEESKDYLTSAKQLGFSLTVHGDQFSTGGSQLAVALGAVSVDHLEASGEKEIAMLAKSEVVCTALPGASIGLGCSFTPARKLLDQGAILAVGSDWNPGSAPMGDLMTQAAILSTFQKLTNAEVFAAMTTRASKALKLNDRGKLSEGMKADFIIFPTQDFRDILYHQGQLKPKEVWKNGKLQNHDR